MKPDPCLINPGLSAVSVPYSGPQSPEEDSSSGGSTNSGEGEHAFLSPSSAFLNFDSESQYSPQRTDSPSHPLTASKHECAICGDRASGKHYGVHSCEGCKGFFKRTVRKELSYTCRENKRCIIDKRQRNRCQYCRYRKCLVAGMRREAVQEERQRNRERGRRLIESLSSENSMEVSVDKILEAEHCADYHDSVRSESKSFISREQLAADCQMVQLVAWAKRIPHFTGLPVDDQVCLLQYAWNELLLAAFSHRSVNVRNGLLLASGLLVERQSAHGAGVGPLFDRVLCELVAKFRDMKVDKTELGCLRAIVLYNSGAKGLKSTQKVEHLREQLFITLEDYCRKVYTHEPGRFARLLLRLPPLRSIGLKCLEHLFFHKVIGNAPVENVLKDMLLKPYD